MELGSLLWNSNSVLSLIVCLQTFWFPVTVAYACTLRTCLENLFWNNRIDDFLTKYCLVLRYYIVSKKGYFDVVMRKNYKENYPMLCTTVLHTVLVYSNYPSMLPLSNLPGWPGFKFGWSLEPEKDWGYQLCTVYYVHVRYYLRKFPLPAIFIHPLLTTICNP